MDTITYVGLDVHKATVCVALSESGRGGELRQLGIFESRPEVLMEAGSPAEQRRAAAELLLRGRPLGLWVAPAADRLWA
jgi:hypothetical protein